MKLPVAGRHRFMVARAEGLSTLHRFFAAAKREEEKDDEEARTLPLLNQSGGIDVKLQSLSLCCTSKIYLPSQSPGHLGDQMSTCAHFSTT